MSKIANPPLTVSQMENWFYGKLSGIYIQTLFDNVQTHGLYGVRKEDKDQAIEILKEKGATRFRTVTANSPYFVIVCFKYGEHRFDKYKKKK